MGGFAQGVDLVLSTRRLNRLIDHAIGDLTVTVEAGMSFAELQHRLHEAGQFLAFDPAYPETATLGELSPPPIQEAGDKPTEAFAIA
uniref:FAD-binding oxidoreductase n=1 Tax=Desertifilum tharense IPPAS B-1220 TaxID=1781255 RepID=A0ACD5GV77_9CYAN